jgi:hypothetical protein
VKAFFTSGIEQSQNGTHDLMKNNLKHGLILSWDGSCFYQITYFVRSSDINAERTLSLSYIQQYAISSSHSYAPLNPTLQ